MRLVSLCCAALLSVMLIVAGMLLSPPGAQAQQAAASSAAPPDVQHSASSGLSQGDIARMLPATDMGANAARQKDPHLAPVSDSPATPFDAAPIPVNPLAPNADAIGAKTCVACHAQENIQASHSLHVISFRAGAANSGPQAACETCHGPGSVHAKDPTAPGSIIAYTHESKTPPRVQAGVCLGCHAGGARQHWVGSVHENRGLSCSDCHNPMTRLSPEGLLAASSINEVCASCHQDIRAKFNRRSHMPLPEGQMACTDCHNPHGSITKPLLKTDTVNETCYTCHAEKRGPFLFEHAPVRENCLNCHDVHGSNQQTLLVAPIPMLCQQCHTMTLHPNDLQTPAGLGTGPHPDERIIGRGCLTCHSNIHGSNNPSGPKFHE
ncbi:DmsE family decaheme c-type cytochrome [Dyella halodurans]|uniref:DmsE family decaheme c-type cytochrome n=1 Tax=Dyella halodurans TaxID=1920171 RepID=A0ABV9C428_9GAMM|nr:DmsE family decaheme c-type cytochrome [Dyella halodurans]